MDEQVYDDQLELIYKSFTDPGCSLEDVSSEMDDRHKWWRRVREMRASSSTMMMIT